MINEVISSILEAEKKAEQIVKDSAVTSRAILEDAESQSRKIKAAANEEIKNERKDKLAKANKEAEDLYKKEIEKAKLSSSKKKEEASKNVDKAVEFIAGRIC